MLQIQRNLQLRIEEQGKYLQMMFEKQYKAGDKLKTSSEVLENPCCSTAHAIPVSPSKNDSGTPQLDERENQNVRADVTTASIQVSRKLGEKQKVPESEDSEELEANAGGASSQPSKRAKADE